MRRVRGELDDLGLPMFSRFATAPVYGGGSWMSKASALSGLRIEAHSTYLAWRQLASRYPHLIAYLNRHGYYTLAVQPASFWNAGTYDYDDVIVRDDFAWDGPVLWVRTHPGPMVTRLCLHELLESAPATAALALLRRVDALRLGAAAADHRRCRRS